MNPQRIQKMQSQFDEMAHHVPDEDIEFWFARELQKPLDHFRGVTKMVALSSDAQREQDQSLLVDSLTK